MTNLGSTTVATPIIAEAKQHDPENSTSRCWGVILGFRAVGFRDLWLESVGA